MTEPGSSAAAPAPALPALPALPLTPMAVHQGIVARWLTPALSAAILVAALWQLRHLDVRGVIAMLPRSPRFWLVFAAGYLAMPASEWVIYRQLWALPPRGFSRCCANGSATRSSRAIRASSISMPGRGGTRR
ncbi:hypothetical protein QP185_22220 [Sphingomonas aerolata]|uniref:hypothetical protein n=1 Tax=Sphingomonas aerolata TaxID=185951 RepID=UPI002FE1F1B5